MTSKSLMEEWWEKYGDNMVVGAFAAILIGWIIFMFAMGLATPY